MTKTYTTVGKSEPVGTSLYARELLPKPASRRTSIWWIFQSEGGAVGKVRWYAQWRRYVFYPDCDTLFDASCLNDLGRFTDSKTRLRKSARKVEKMFEDSAKRNS